MSRDDTKLGQEIPPLPPGAERLGAWALVGLLERLTPGAARVGELGPAADERVRFRHDPSLSFSARDLSEVRVRRTPPSETTFLPPPEVYTVTGAFLGLTGSASPLPSYLAEEVAQEDADARVQGDFLDLFHHRLMSLLYRVLARSNGPAEHTRALDDAWSLRLLALAGLDAFSGLPLPQLPVASLLALAPVLTRRGRGPEALAHAISACLGRELGEAQVEVHEFVGAWEELPLAARFLLGQANRTLGQDTVLGRQIFEKGGSFDIRVTRVSHALYRELSPGGALLRKLQSVVGLMVRDPLAYRVVVELRAEEVPSLRLAAREGSLLGRTSWLGRVSAPVPVVVALGNPLLPPTDASLSS